MSSKTLTYEIGEACTKDGTASYRVKKRVESTIISNLKIAYRIYVYKRVFGKWDLIAIMYPQNNTFFSNTGARLKKHYTYSYKKEGNAEIIGYRDDGGRTALLNTIASKAGNLEYAMKIVFDFEKARNSAKKNVIIPKAKETKMAIKKAKKRTLKNYKNVVKALKLAHWIKHAPPHKRETNPGVGTNTRFVGVIADGVYLYKTMPDSKGDALKRNLRKMRKITGGAVKLHKTPRKRTKKSRR